MFRKCLLKDVHIHIRKNALALNIKQALMNGTSIEIEEIRYLIDNI